ncbi:hypothetical protein Tco_0848871 [Tanacetum coccineum]
MWSTSCVYREGNRHLHADREGVSIAKLLVEQDNEISRELLRKIFMQFDYAAWYVHFKELDAYVTARSLAKLSKVAESPRLADKMKYVFGRSRGAAKSLEHMRVIVARDAVTLGELETLLARAQVGVSLKAGFVADIEVKD